MFLSALTRRSAAWRKRRCFCAIAPSPCPWHWPAALSWPIQYQTWRKGTEQKPNWMSEMFFTLFVSVEKIGRSIEPSVLSLKYHWTLILTTLRVLFAWKLIQSVLGWRWNLVSRVLFTSMALLSHQFFTIGNSNFSTFFVECITPTFASSGYIWEVRLSLDTPGSHSDRVLRSSRPIPVVWSSI